jgi:multidrug efflux pump subunit AcrA (membrane-fusion protein)
MKTMRRRLVFILFVAGLVLSACGGAATTPTSEAPPVVVDDIAVIAEGRLLPKESRQLSFSTGGKVVEILVAEGAQVQEGDVIARLENSEALQAQVAQAQLELLNAQQALQDLKDSADMAAAQAVLAVAQAQDALEKAQKRLKNLQAPDLQWYQDQVDNARDALEAAQRNAEITDIGALKAGLQAAKDALEDATKRLNELKDLEARYPGGFTDALKDAQKAHDLAVDNVRVMELQLEQAQSGSTNALEDAQEALDDALRAQAKAQGSPDAIQLSLAQANVKMAEATLKDAQERAATLQAGPDPDQLKLAEERVKTAEAALAAAEAAFENSELRTPLAGTVADLNLKVAEQVAPGQPVVTIADFSGWIVETDNLTEIDVVRITMGQGASVVLDALPEETLHGTVTAIDNIYVEQRGDITYKVTLTLTDRNPEMRWGMTAQVTFDK